MNMKIKEALIFGLLGVLRMENKSNNQKIYSEIRGFMDNAVKGYEYRKKVTEIIQEKQQALLIQKQKEEQENKKIE